MITESILLLNVKSNTDDVDNYAPTTSPQTGEHLISLTYCNVLGTMAMTHHGMTLWASEHLLSVKAFHILSLANRSANLMFQGSPLPDKRRLLSTVVKWIYVQFGKARVDLLWKEKALQDEPPLGLGCVLAEETPLLLLRRIPPLSERVRLEQLSVILVTLACWLVPKEVTHMLAGQPS